jgi:predicted membrane-bound spermidine synthase
VGWIQAVFFLSGCAALLYQVVWQRALFAIYGINVESATVVVTAFMVGLGLGSLAGGVLSRDPRRPALVWFAAIEGGIGLYGLCSLRIFRWVGAATLHAPAAGTALATFLLVLLPTLLMGSTLPLLVGHAVRASGNVGRSVGGLYYVNTLGSAVASLAAVLVLLGRLGQAGTIRVAALLNFAVAAGALWRHARAGRAA